MKDTEKESPESNEINFLTNKEQVTDNLGILLKYLRNIRSYDLSTDVLNLIESLKDEIEELRITVQDSLHIEDIKIIDYLNQSSENTIQIIIPLVSLLKNDKIEKIDIQQFADDILVNYSYFMDGKSIFISAYLDLRESNDQIISKLHNIIENSKNDLTSKNKDIKNLNLQLDQSHKELERYIDESEKLTQQIYSMENKPIAQIYSDASDKYRKLEKHYRKAFLGSIAGLLAISALLIFFKNDITSFLNSDSNQTNRSLIEFWAIKISVILVGITLISYFLKQSSHYQKLADQSHQTQVELLAYPNFMNSVPPEQAIEIRKELALKYFGRELDSSPHKDISNIMSDQMKNTTELVKATTDAIKNINKTPPTQ